MSTEDADARSHLEEDMWQVPSNIRHHIMNFLSSTLTPALLQSYEHKLDILSRSSYYVKLTGENLPQPDELYSQDSNLWDVIDPVRLQRMKDIGNSQVKVSLALLEELYGELRRGRDELEAFLDGKGLAYLALDEAAVQEKMSSLLQVALDIEAVVFPMQLHLKHQLISDVRIVEEPYVEMVLDVKMPIVFDKTLTRAYADSVVLHWHVEGQPQHEPNEKFEIGYKLLQPRNEEEEPQMTVATCATYCHKIRRLRPNRCYEFSVKRVEYDDLVCTLWKESIVLRTTSETT